LYNVQVTKVTFWDNGKNAKNDNMGTGMDTTLREKKMFCFVFGVSSWMNNRESWQSGQQGSKEG
jgi:hypothetical protein